MTWGLLSRFYPVLALLIASACSADLDAQQAKLDNFVAGNQIGSSNDYWLEMFNLAGEWERVALIYGYFEDYSGCSDIADALMKEYSREYRCIPAN
ncbi:hypothetical protein K1X12_04265 [Hyphomonas sp. WL0036]|uniref:hypothetical protein n=1 Tax=Hyphomonas sediminis TaxID=2866160 RepID=UPI001C807208|nr:hypothetical protein [Hyphomonas sediminis]MBY9066099.1 hypothetical protein [Hyphomonas sediminis]